MTHFFRKSTPNAFHASLALNLLAVIVALSVLGYTGTFSRDLADDYCMSASLHSAGGVFPAAAEKYDRWMGRYASIFPFWAFDRRSGFGPGAFPAALLLAWVGGMYSLWSEMGASAGLRRAPGLFFWLAGLTVFLSLYQAPNLDQVFYWRSGAIPYSVPLAIFSGVGALAVRFLRVPRPPIRSFFYFMLLLGLVLFAGGMSETAGGLQLGIFSCAAVICWIYGQGAGRKRASILFLALAAAAAVSIVLIAVAPGTQVRLAVVSERTVPTSDPVLLGLRIARYTFEFLVDAALTRPLPLLSAFVSPMLGVYAAGLRAPARSAQWMKRFAFFIPLMALAGIAFSFAPSAFAQSFPSERVRMGAHFILTLWLAMAGALSGAALPGSKNQSFARAAACLLFALLAVHPANAALSLSGRVPFYQERASMWDQRDAEILAAVSDGARDLVVRQMDSHAGIAEYKERPDHWVNRCAARYYGLDTLRAVVPPFP